MAQTPTASQVLTAVQEGRMTPEEGRRALIGLGLDSNAASTAISQVQNAATPPLVVGEPGFQGPPGTPAPPAGGAQPTAAELALQEAQRQAAEAAARGTDPAGSATVPTAQGGGGAVVQLGATEPELSLGERQIQESIRRGGRQDLFQQFVNAGIGQNTNISPFARNLALSNTRFDPLSAQFVLSSAFAGLPLGGTTGSEGLGLPVSGDPAAGSNFAAFLQAQPEAFTRQNFQSAFGGLAGFIGQGIGTPEGTAISQLLASENPEIANLIAAAFGSGLGGIQTRGILSQVQRALSGFQGGSNANLFQSFLQNEIPGLQGFF